MGKDDFTVESVVVYKRLAGECPMVDGRDTWWHDEMDKVTADCDCEWVESEHPLFMLYTSGSTGKPKGIVHTTAGYMLGAWSTFKYTFDYKPGEVYWCTADIGWITGHSYIVYGPLLERATTVMFEGVPTYPDAGRCWAICEKHKVNQFYTAPTAVRALMKAGDDYVTKHDRSSLRILGSVGEPINPEAWRWYYSVVGEERCPIVDTYWQTETGSFMITPLPGATPLKPGSATLPFFGVQPVVLDDKGNELEGEASGFLAIKKPWPSASRSCYGDHARFESVYYSMFKGYYVAGDGCRRDADGYYWITGRVDDVINVSGHRMGTAEVEVSVTTSSLRTHSHLSVLKYPITTQLLTVSPLPDTTTVRARASPRVLRGGGRRHAPRDQGCRDLLLRRAQGRAGAERRHDQGAQGDRAQGDWTHRHTGRDTILGRFTEDPLGEDHAADLA